MTDKLTQREFEEKSGAAISQLEAAFSRLANEYDIDVEVEGGVLKVDFAEGEPGKFIVSPNSSVNQLWLSARMSSYKFDWSDGPGFVLATTGEPLRDVISRLTAEQLGDESVVL
jgi:iron donor protein CyaY